MFVLSCLLLLLTKMLYELGRTLKSFVFPRRPAASKAPETTPPPQTRAPGARAWDWKALLLAGEFDKTLNLTPEETHALLQANFLGELHSVHDVRFVLETIRRAQSTGR